MSLQPREVPTDRAFTAPHSHLFHATRCFAADLARAEDKVRSEWRELRGTTDVPPGHLETPEVERLSLAVQVFAAMTIEAGISVHAVVRFGGESHDEHFRWESPVDRLKKVLTGVGVRIGDDAELYQIVSRLAKTRNAIVHPRSQEVLDPATGGQRLPNREYPRMDGDAARQALIDLERFFQLLMQIDPSASGMLHPW